MDIAIARKKPAYGKYIALGVVVLTALLIGVRALWVLSLADFSLERSKLTFGQVQQGDFTVSVRGNGVLVPENIQWLAAETEATVIRRVLKAGHIVSKGDLIAELANPQLVQLLAETQWELTATEEELKAAQVQQETELLSQKSIVENAKLNFERSQLEYVAQTDLIKTGAVSKIAFQRTQLETSQFEQRWHTSQEQYLKMQQNLLAQNRARQARLSQMKNRLERLQQRVDGLQVRATFDSIVLDVPIEAGQRIQAGANIAKLAQQDALYAELSVPELKINDVAVGQKVLIDTRNTVVNGKVARIDPTVINGNVQVDVVFTQPLPSDARPDLSVDGEIITAHIENTLYVTRPLLSQSNSRAALYKVRDDNQFAERVHVSLGASSPNRIQILEGLNAGDTIVVSDPSLFQTYNIFRLR
ncbi:efflux RND transporter periplasmic adaptor subunit [Saccharophagus degradans]|uniref:Secretion protein HlyD n=1 Tax=Saccharophagus degradans (strain 2-40 / ATCC 43961 / DSM 17024) TaxID=203122 RepID=Q21P06_SACD2|nr:HlyD family efflux transporter periplasmic adaptor subunit [Saccharophagus degradans]ABD79573.1 Secretion protein HlyD [Saccharophagus degradans 2-40]